MGVMFWKFYGCPQNNAVLIITVGLCVLATTLQLFVSSTGSLLVSSIVVAYSTYLCYAAVVLNPNVACNPTLASNYQNLSQGIGIALTVLSLAYTAYSTGNNNNIRLHRSHTYADTWLTIVNSGSCTSGSGVCWESGVPVLRSS
jgi:hypothetical protein